MDQEMRDMPVTKIIEEAANDFCAYYCKYQAKAVAAGDDDIEECSACPLQRLF